MPLVKPDMPDDCWEMILGWYLAGETVGTLKLLRNIAWVNHACALLASRHEDNWPWIREHAHSPMYRYLHRRAVAE